MDDASDSTIRERSAITVLRRRGQTTLHPTLPFHFVATAHKPSHFPTPTEVFAENTLWFTMTWCEAILGVRMEPGPDSAVLLSVYADRPLHSAEIEQIASELTFRFGMYLDLSDFVRLAALDPLLGPVEARWRGMRPSCAYALFELLCITIVLQNATVRRSTDMLQRLLETYGRRVRFDGRTLLAFFSPSRIAAASEEELRGLKVGYRAKMLRRVAEFFVEHETFENDLRSGPPERAANLLRQIYGVGLASVWYLLFEGFKHVDAFDHVSPWEAKILGKLLFNDETVGAERVVRTATKRWGAWRMLAVHYLFEDIFWQRRAQRVPWLEKLIRL